MQYRLSTVNLSRTIDSPNAANPAVYEDISPQCNGIADCCSETIGRAVKAATTTIQNVRVDHCRAHVFVAQEFLNCANVVTVFKQVSGEQMAKTMAHCRFGYPRLLHSVFHGLRKTDSCR